MIATHAADEPGRLANDAAKFASAVLFNLTAAASATVPTPERLEALEKLFTAWPSLCRRMSALEQAAPRCAAAGLEKSARLLEIADRTREAA